MIQAKKHFKNLFHMNLMHLSMALGIISQLGHLRAADHGHHITTQGGQRYPLWSRAGRDCWAESTAHQCMRVHQKKSNCTAFKGTEHLITFSISDYWAIGSYLEVPTPARIPLLFLCSYTCTIFQIKLLTMNLAGIVTHVGAWFSHPAINFYHPDTGFVLLK